MHGLPTIGYWRPGAERAAFSAAAMAALLPRVREPIHLIQELRLGRLGLAVGGEILSGDAAQNGVYPLQASLPPLYPEWLGSRLFCEIHGLRFPYIAGEMANGIASTRMVIEIARAHMLGFFGAAALDAQRVEQAIVELEAALGPDGAWGINLIHSPNEAALEDHLVDLFLRRQVRRVSASAFMALTPAVVRYAASGLTTDASGRVVRKNHLLAKISRSEVARRFMAPAPPDMLQALVARGLLTAQEAALAARVPVAGDITAEADSGGHTDNQALSVLIPAMLAVRDELTQKHAYDVPIRVGAAGGFGTPGAVAAAFSLGAAYVLTGSVNQAAIESGMSDAGREMLAQADVADVTMAPSADMFELGVRVQVLKRGTMFAARAQKLYECYVHSASIEAIPPDVRARLESEIFRAPLDEIWRQTREFWNQRDPSEISRAERDPKHRMALVFRWYLGNSSRWAIQGDLSRRMDYQLWCGPAMGGFNRWVAGSFLEPWKNRTVVQIALNLLEGAAVITRAHQLRTYGALIPDSAFDFRPRPLV